MRKPLNLIVLILVATTMPACDLLTGPALYRYRDVGWGLVRIEGAQEMGTISVPISLGEYSYAAPAGQHTTCLISGSLSPHSSWNWIEDMRGNVLAVGPARDSKTYLEIYVSVQATCASRATPDWFMHGRVSVPAALDLRKQFLALAEPVLTEGTFMHSPIPEPEFKKWIALSAGSVALADTMRIPLTLTVRPWSLPAGNAQALMLAELTRSFTLVFVRYESINERGSP